MAPVLYRKRIIPEESVLLKDDVILDIFDGKIITGWRTLKPRKDFHHGLSLYFLDEGIKISKFMKEDNSLLYWYCDVIKADYDKDADVYTFTDLLADVIIYPDGNVKVVDLEEIAEALSLDRIDKDDVGRLLVSLDKLLKWIYSGEFENYKEMIDKWM